MIEEKLDRMENMLVQLVRMVGDNNKDQKSLRGQMTLMNDRLDSMEGRLDKMEGRLDSMEDRFNQMDGRIDRVEKKSEERHQIVMNKLEEMQLGQDYMLEKINRNEKEIAIIKRRMNM
ncbi:hypothetical protein ACLIA0_06490 [Bacillaceae bacterium W0354]